MFSGLIILYFPSFFKENWQLYQDSKREFILCTKEKMDALANLAHPFFLAES
jgi:hypothetical protein